MRQANEHASDLAPTIEEIKRAGHSSLRGIATALNDRGIPTARGEGKWSAVQVSRTLRRI
jgi:hypothetical protein